MPKASSQKREEVAEIKEADHEVVEDFTAQTPKVLTNYRAFVQAKLVPIEARCESNWRYFKNGYLGCHSKVNLKTPNEGEDLIRHLDAGHSGGFLVKFRPVREGVWKGWKTLINNGVEIANLNCMVCNSDVMIHPQQIARHIKPHLNHRKRMEKGGKFRIAFSKEAPLPEDDFGLMPETEFDFVDGFDE